MVHRPARGGKVVERLVAYLVADANLERLDLVEHVEFGERYSVDAGDLDRLAHHHRIEPATAPLTTCNRAELPAALADMLADLVILLGRKGAFADPRGVGLGDAKHIIDGARPDAAADRSLGGHGVRGCDKGVGAVVNVEHRPLRALEEDALAGPTQGR